MIEEFDILEIKKYISKTNRDDVISAYNKLMTGSENHLRIFASNLKDKVIEYQPKYLSQADYNRIIAGTAAEFTASPVTKSPSQATTFKELARNGKQSYSNNCVNCHGESLSTGPAAYAALSKYRNAQSLLEKYP